jgi:hypothetical protein
MQRLAAAVTNYVTVTTVTKQHRSAASPPRACSDADASACRGHGKPIAPVPDPPADVPPSAARARGQGSSSLPSAPPPPPPPPPRRKLDDCPRNWAAERGRGGWAPAVDGTYVFGALGPDQGNRCDVLVCRCSAPSRSTRLFALMHGPSQRTRLLLSRKRESERGWVGGGQRERKREMLTWMWKHPCARGCRPVFTDRMRV